jgi:hypothetical protein
LTTKKDFNALKRGSSMKAMITNRMVPRKLWNTQNCDRWKFF